MEKPVLMNFDCSAAEERMRGECVFAAAILDTVDSLVIVLDRKGRILRFNRACESLTGYSSGEVLGRPFWDFLLVEEEIEPVKAVFASLAAGRFPNQHENDWIAKDGSRRRIAWRNSAIPGPDGEVAYVIGAGVDITSQRTTEDALHESERRYASLFHNHHTVMLLIDPHSESIVDANPAACAFYGYSLEEIKEKKIAEINTLTPAEVHEEMQRALAQSRNHFLFRHRLANGEEREVEVYSGPIQAAGKDLLYSIIHDISGRKQREELVASLSRFPDENPSPVMRISNEGVLLYANQASEPIQATWHCRVGQKTPPEWHEILQSATNSGQPVELDVEARGMIFSCILQSIPGEGYINLYGRDATEQRRLETEREKAQEALQSYASRLEIANRELQYFASIASHDLQEPLRKIRTFGERLNTRLGSTLDEEAADYLVRMIQAASRMQAMISDLLAYSRVNTQGQPFCAVDLYQAASQAVADLEVRIEQTGGKVLIEELPVIEADPQQMYQLFQNLIGNALKYHQPSLPPLVKVSGRILPLADPPSPKLVDVRVVDNGIGFKPEYAERIFQPFQRLHGRSEFEGTGIGLSICRKIVERHGGTIRAESVPGEGTTFIIRLPVARR